MRIGLATIYHQGNFFQSFEGKYFKYLGKPRNIFDSAEYHNFSEILVIHPKNPPISSSYASTKKITDFFCAIPLIISGDILENKAQWFDTSGVERYAFNSLCFEEENDLHDQYLKDFGRQALLGIIPFVKEENHYYALDYSRFKKRIINQNLIDRLFHIYDEIIFHDISSHGLNCGFDFNIFESINIPLNRTIICGGVNLNSIPTAKKLNIAAVYFENISFHSETLIYDHMR